MVKDPLSIAGVWSLVQEDPTCLGATKSMCYNCWPQAPRACTPQQETPLQREVHTLQQRVASTVNWRKPDHRNEDPEQRNKQTKRISFSSDTRQHLLFLVFSTVAILTMWDDISWFWFAFPWWLVSWASFHVPIGQLYVFFGKTPIQVLYAFCNWVVCFFHIELYEFFIYFGY